MDNRIREQRREGAKLIELLHLAFLQVLPSYLPVGQYVVMGWGKPAPLRAAAIRQKLNALVERSESEPRDVFDLDLLFGQYPGVMSPGEFDPERLKQAEAIALSLPFEACQALVVDFIEDDFVPILEREEVWDETRLAVAAHLERLR